MTSSSTDLKVWVKEAVAEEGAFRVTVSENDIVDDLKDVIKIKQELQGPASKLQIKAAEDGEPLPANTEMSSIDAGHKMERPIFFTQPAGKLIFKP
jgi:hypothetical protein